MSSQLADNLEAVQRRISAAAQRAGRSADDITLVAVTKTHPLQTVIQAYQAGVRHFGENRLQEGNEKADQFAAWLNDNPELELAHWHFIGHIQSRKAEQAISGRYRLLHGVDSLKLARRIDRLAKRENYPPAEVLLQCNVSGESTKYGFSLTNWQSDETKLTAFLATLDKISKLEKLTVKGLMTMAPLVEDAEMTRPVFRSLAALQRKLQNDAPQFNWQHLSMGMTDDFDVAIEEGATIIRVGRAIFGERNY